MAQPNGRQLDTLYRLAWRRGLKTTYYLRSQAATHVEKSTLTRTDGKLNAVAVDAAQTLNAIEAVTTLSAPACSIDNPDCEACQ